MEVKKYIIASLVILAFKVLFGILLNSNTLLASGILEIIFIVFNLLGTVTKDNKKYKGLFTALLGIVFTLLSAGVVFYSIVSDINNPSWLIILICFLILFVRYTVTCFGIINTYNRRKGTLLVGNVNSSLEFIVLGVILGSLIVSKLGYFVNVLKYGDVLGTIVISLISSYYGIRLIVNSMKYMGDKDINKSIDENEISKQKEVKKVQAIKVFNFGGLRRINVSLILNDGINITDISTFGMSLQDYILKHSDVAVVELYDQYQVVNKVHVRSKKEDARNSGSGNSKTNSKKKNTKKANKKR